MTPLPRRSFLASLAAVLLPWRSQKAADVPIHFGVTCGTLTIGGTCTVKRINPGTRAFDGTTDTVDFLGNEVGKDKTVAYAETAKGMVATSWMV